MNFDNIDLINKLINKRNWTLEGDGLFLSLMFDISKQLEKSTIECLQNLNQLSNNLEKTNIALENTNNKIYCLQNTKYIENRVFDDDETAILKTDVETKRDDENPINTILNNNLRVMTKYHEKVSIDFNESDEEDVDRNKNIIYRSKTLYEMRPLPHIFWTKDWREKSHVGIYESDEDFSDNENEEYSDSGDNTSLPSKTATVSESSSSLLALNSSNCAQNKLSSSEDNLGSSTSTSITKYHDIDRYYVHKPKSNITQIDAEIKSVPHISNDFDKIGSQIKSNIFNDEPPELDDSHHNSDQLTSSKNNFFATSDDKHEKNKKPTLSYADDHKQVENENKFTRKTINLFEDNDDNDDFDKLINGLKEHPIEKKSSIITKHSKNLFDSDSEEDISSQISIPENCNKLTNFASDTIKIDRNLSPNNLSNNNPMLPKIDSIINNKSKYVNTHTSSSFRENLIDDLGCFTTEQNLKGDDQAKKFSIDLFGEESPEEDEFDILFNRSLNKKNILKPNTQKELHQKYNSSFQGKLFDSESDDELIAKVDTTNLKVNSNKLKDSLKEDGNTSKSKSMLPKDILLGSHSEGDTSTLNTERENLFDFIKNDKLKESSIYQKADLHSDKNTESYMIESENITDPKRFAESIPSTSLYSPNFEKSYTRVEKLFDSESEDGEIQNKSNMNYVMDDSQAKFLESETESQLNSVKSFKSGTTTLMSEATIIQSDDPNFTEKNKVFANDQLDDDFFPLHKKESCLENVDVILTSSQPLSAGFVSIGLFEDIPPEDDNDDSVLFTNQTKRTQNVFYDDFADAIPAAASNMESIPYSYNIFDDEPPPDTENEHLVESGGLKKDVFSTLNNHNHQMERKDISENIKKSFPKSSSTIKANAANEANHDNLSELPIPKKLSKSQLSINVHALLEGAKLQIEKKQLSFLDPPNDEKSSADISTLGHLNKHRAKLPMNRKPSTRRGRHESYKKTMAYQAENENFDDELEPSILISNEDNIHNKPKSVSKKTNLLNTTAVLFPSDDENDVTFTCNKSVAVPSISNVDKNPQSTTDNIHDKPKSVSKKLNLLNTTKKALFSSDDEDGGLFGKHSLSATKKNEIKRRKKTNKTQQGSIFDNISDDDDSLFTVADKKLYPKKIIQSSSKNTLFKSSPDNPLGK